MILPEILVLVGGAMPPAPAVPASTRISARLRRVQEHSSPVNIVPRNIAMHYMGAPDRLSHWTRAGSLETLKGFVGRNHHPLAEDMRE